MPENVRFFSKPIYALLLLVTLHGSAQPRITSFSPASGPVGTTVTISGTGFHATPTGNIVYFGAVRATVTNAAATSVTVTVPAGATYEPITILNTATRLAGYSAGAFDVTFTNPFGSGIPANFYRPKVDFTTSGFDYFVVISDLDGDRKPDMVVANYSSSSLSIFRNTSVTGTITASSFAPRVDISTGERPFTLAVGDIDGDGKPDLAVANSNSSYITLYRNASVTGSLTTSSFVRTDIGMGTEGSSNFIAIRDIDQDGKPDVIVNDSHISILRNISAASGSITAASFAPKVTLSASGFFTLCDIDGDTKVDLLNSEMSVLRNVSTPGVITDASFEAPVSFPTLSTAAAVTTGDLDGDGKPDVVVTDLFANQISVYRNTAVTGRIDSASFAPRLDFSLPVMPRSTAIADMDGDGKPDILIAYQEGDGAAVMRNISSPGSLTASSFEAKVDFPTGKNCVVVAAGDLDGDGIPEIAAANAGANTLSVLRIGSLPPPAVSSFSPASGAAGTAVTITGNNFNAIAANNIVYFGAVRATVKSSTSTSLSVTVPVAATYQPVSVLNTANGLLGYSSKPFTGTFTHPLGSLINQAGYYHPKADFATGALPYYVALGDLDNDGKPDMVVANSSANTVSILRNTAVSGFVNASSFAARIDLPAGADPRAVAIGDMNGDGRQDIIVANAGAGTVTVLINSFYSGILHASSFYIREDYITGGNPFSVAIGDLDADGLPDIAVANQSSATVSVLRNTTIFKSASAPTFAPKVDYAAGNYPRAVAISDLDGDGRADIAVANERSGTVSVLRNTSGLPGVIDNASFAAMTGFATGSNPNCIAASDIDGDGKPDLVVCNYGSNTVSVLRNTAVAGAITASSFAEKTDFSTGPQPFFVTTAEVDGDGKPDLVVASSSSNSLSVLHNTAVAGVIAASSFDARANLASGGYPVSVAAADLDGDGITDLVSANAGANNLSVLAFNSLQHPVVSSLSAASGPAGSTITITGANFNAIHANNTVYFGAVKAAVTGGSSTSLTVTVPAGATYQPVSVLNSARGLTGYSSGPFTATFANPFGTGVPGNFYRPKVDIALGGPLTFAVAFGDFDGDGKPDMVAVNESANSISVLRNGSAAGSMDAASFDRVDFATGAAPRSVVVMDADGDGRLDIIVACPASNTISVLTNKSAPGAVTSASFAPRVDFNTGTYVSSFAAGDLDDDGRPDLVIANAYLGTVSVWRNTSTAGSFDANSFTAKTDLITGSFPRSVAIGDVDGDGKPDIIVANEQSGSVSVLRNTGKAGSLEAISFAAKVDFAVGANPPAVALGDVDGDGKPDVVAASFNAGTLSILRNTGTAGNISASSFAPKVDFVTGNNPFSVAIGDADGDGRPDLVTANANANTISVLRNNGTAGSLNASSFAAKADFGAGGYPLSVVLGDLDGDGIAEVATANASGGTISVFKVNGPAAMAATAAAPGALAAIARQAQADLQLYPNPTRGAFILQLPGLKTPATTVEVFDVNGSAVERRVIHSTDNKAGFALRLDLHNRPAGIYYVKVTGVDGVRVVKVELQR